MITKLQYVYPERISIEKGTRGATWVSLKMRNRIDAMSVLKGE